MARLTVGQICDAIEDTLDEATTLAVSQSYDELTEGLHDFPLLQVYPETGNTDASGRTDRTTFGAGVRTGFYVFHADYHACPRSFLAEDMEKVVDGIDALEIILEAQNTKPYFGLAGIRAFRYEWRRVAFRYAQQDTMGVRFIISVWIF